jgi:UDP-glucuronate 4-epimerase
MRILVTGAAGFIGFHVARALLARGDDVIGFDNVNAYYDVRIKEARLRLLAEEPRFQFVRGDLADRTAVEALFAQVRPPRVVHLAAQAGVRYSIDNPHAYVDANITGFLNILEACRHGGVEHLVYASSSSVYGGNTKLPFSVDQSVDHPLSLYAASKKSNELMAHVYAHLFRLPVTGLRFFTVYGPWGRPDMALFKFTRAILAGEPIDIYNSGAHERDFTYIDDIVEGIVRTLDRIAAPDPDFDTDRPRVDTSDAPYRIYNIGNTNPEPLMKLVGCLERELGRTAIKNMLPMQPGDVPKTSADVGTLTADVGFRPATPLEVGIRKFVAWYREFYGSSG